VHVLIPIIAQIAIDIFYYWKDGIDVRSNKFGCCPKLASCRGFEIGSRHLFPQHLFASLILAYPFRTCRCCCHDVRMHYSFQAIVFFAKTLDCCFRLPKFPADVLSFFFKTSFTWLLLLPPCCCGFQKRRLGFFDSVSCWP